MADNRLQPLKHLGAFFGFPVQNFAQGPEFSIYFKDALEQEKYNDDFYYKFANGEPQARMILQELTNLAPRIHSYFQSKMNQAEICLFIDWLFHTTIFMRTGKKPSGLGSYSNAASLKNEMGNDKIIKNLEQASIYLKKALSSPYLSLSWDNKEVSKKISTVQEHIGIAIQIVDDCPNLHGSLANQSRSERRLRNQCFKVLRRLRFPKKSFKKLISAIELDFKEQGIAQKIKTDTVLRQYTEYDRSKRSKIKKTSRT